MRCPKCDGPIDTPTRKLCVSCIGDAVKNTGESTYSEKIHDAKMNAGWYVKRGQMAPRKESVCRRGL